MPLPDLPLVVLDTETTGFIPRVNRIIEFASMRFAGGKKLEEYEQLISIPTAIPEVVSSLTRIRDEDLKGQPSMDEARQHILEHIPADAIIVGQNIGFDLRMLKGEGIDLTDRVWIDTSMLASLVFPELASYSLSYVSQTLGLDHAPVHRALGDVRATAALLSRCWERLMELTPALREPLDSIMQRAPEGYHRLFAALPPSTAKSTPAWLASRRRKIDTPSCDPADVAMDWMRQTGDGVQLVEAPLAPDFVQRLLEEAASGERPTWIAVKNVRAAQRTLRIPDLVQVFQPASTLLNHEAVVAFAQEKNYTADEATLALKLAWYEPNTIDELPIHGEERAVWQGKIAATPQSESYLAQFQNVAPVVLMNHWQLLSIAGDQGHPAYGLLTSGKTHIIVDDASMLEDTATKAYGFHCEADYLRAAANDDANLTKLTDLLQIWLERTRQGQDVYYLRPADVHSADAVSVRQRAAELRRGMPDSAAAARILDNLVEALNPDALKERIAFIETRQDGRQALEAVPARVGDLLQENLYKKTAVSLLIPPNSSAELNEVIPSKTTADLIAMSEEERKACCTVPMAIIAGRTLDTVLENPPDGRTVVLCASRSRIEEAYIRHSVAAEEKGITLICQNLSGGMGRMQAEFCAAKGKAVWVLTPWSFETAELPAGTIDHLIIETLPFDHPSHTILSKRADRYQNAFAAYSLPRAKHRLYRLLRTFCHFRSKKGDVWLLDKRLEEKEYGRGLADYLKSLTVAMPPPALEEALAVPEIKADAPLLPRKTKRKADDQLPLF